MDTVPAFPGNKSKKYYAAGAIAGLLVLIFAVYYFFDYSPNQFQPETVVSVLPGEGVSAIAKSLESAHVIDSAFWFKVFIVLQGGQHKSIAGDYVFHKRSGLFQISRRILSGDFEENVDKVTFPEGITISDMATILSASSSLSYFDKSAFLLDTRGLEGYLFPDTYFFPTTSKADEIISAMRSNFSDQTKPLTSEIAQSGRSFSDIIIMASILEDEAKTPSDQKIVAGILWKRLDQNMYLQVDSPFRYVTGKTSAELTAKDLESTSLYNTYNRHGLPPTPISNPGLSAIEAALSPTTTPYYFFLSDNNGVMHYAVTGAQHEANVQKYLR